MKIEIVKYLDKMGVRHSLSGFDYLVRAIEIGLEDKKTITKNIVKNCYEVIGKENDISFQRVERTIRHAIQTSEYPNMCNSEFIAKAVDSYNFV